MVHYPDYSISGLYPNYPDIGSDSVNCLDNPCTITSANIENGFGGNKEEYISDSYQEK